MSSTPHGDHISTVETFLMPFTAWGDCTTREILLEHYSTLNQSTMPPCTYKPHNQGISSWRRLRKAQCEQKYNQITSDTIWVGWEYLGENKSIVDFPSTRSIMSLDTFSVPTFDRKSTYSSVTRKWANGGLCEVCTITCVPDVVHFSLEPKVFYLSLKIWVIAWSTNRQHLSGPEIIKALK